MKLALVAIVTFSVLGCASQRPQEIDATAFKNYGDFPAQHTIYVGSDAEFHYFNWANFPHGDGQWKVRKSAMPLHAEWTVDAQRRAFVTRDSDGNWQLKGTSK